VVGGWDELLTISFDISSEISTIYLNFRCFVPIGEIKINFGRVWRVAGEICVGLRGNGKRMNCLSCFWCISYDLSRFCGYLAGIIEVFIHFIANFS
jgi:hypothetical protein